MNSVVLIKPGGGMSVHVGVVLMKEDESLDETCKVCYYSRSGLECGLLSRSGVLAAVMTHCVGEESQVVQGKLHGRKQ